MTTISRAGTTPASPQQASNDLQHRVLEQWQHPIDFYGKVVDQNSSPVAGAQITFHWMETPDNAGSRSSNTVSDSQGLFTFHGKGPSLEVSFGKDGYYSSHDGHMGFNYALGPNPISPDPQNPVIFTLHAKGQGANLLTSDNGMRSGLAIRVPVDNTPVRLDFFQKQVNATGQLEIRQSKPPWRSATNWSFSLSIQNGGLVENHEEFQFKAPDTNYRPAVEYQFRKGEANWARQVIKQFYITFGEPRKFGWIRIESNLAQETIFLTYAINPTGSRNLEPTN